MVRIKIFLLIMIAIMVVSNGSANQSIVASIIHPPTPANISLNEDVTLRCTAVAQHIVWRVNGVNVDEILDPAFDSQITLENATGGVTIYTGRLRIRGTTSTNRSVIDCLAIYRSLDGVLSSAISEQVLIQVQGVLDSVKNLHVNIHEKNLQINWDPPYTLNGVSVSRYEVVVGTIIAFLSTEGNITTTNQSIEQLLAYTVSVRPVNLAGIGAETKINARVTPPSTTSSSTVYTQQVSTPANCATPIAISPSRDPLTIPADYIAPMVFLFILLICVPGLGLLLLLLIIYSW